MTSSSTMKAISLSETKRRLFEVLQCGQMQQENCGPHLTHRTTRESAPLSLMQEQVLEFETKTPGIPPVYNESVTIRRFGSLDPQILERSLAEVIRRHEIWRTTYDSLDGQAVQVIQPAYERFPLPRVELLHVAESDREEAALRLAQEQSRQPFDLRSGPLLRALLVRMTREEHRLFITLHQSIVDGVSVYQILPSELIGLYDCFSSGRPSTLPELTIQYADFARWHRQWAQGEELARSLDYWRQQLTGQLPMLAWPTDRRCRRGETYRGALQQFKLSKTLRDSLRVLSQRFGVTLFMTILAAFTALLHSYTRQDDIVVGTLSPAGRKRPEFQKLLGYFLNPVPLRLRLLNDITFCELLRQAREVTIQAISHDDIPLEILARELNLKPRTSGNLSFFQVAISLAPPLASLASGWNQTFMDADSGGARWELYIELSDRPEGMLGRAQYNPDIFRSETITRALRDLEVLLEVFAVQPQLHLSDLPRLLERSPVEEKARIADHLV